MKTVLIAVAIAALLAFGVEPSDPPTVEYTTPARCGAPC